MTDLLNQWSNVFNPDAFMLFKTIGISYIALLWLSIIIWVTRDALLRSNRLLFQAFVILINIFIPILGVLIYLIIRPSDTQFERLYQNLEERLVEMESNTENEKNHEGRACDKCLMAVEENFVFCPNCSHSLKKICLDCKKAYPKKWNTCPFCGIKYKEKGGGKKKVNKASPSKKEQSTEKTDEPEKDNES